MPEKKGAQQPHTSIDQSLPEKELLFYGFVKQNIDGILLVNPQGIVVEWNASMEKLSGFNREEILGTTVWESQLQLNVNNG